MDKLMYELPNLDSVDSAFKALYKEIIRDGKSVYQLDVDGAVSVSEKDRIYNALESERKIKSGFEKTVKEFGDWTPDKIREISEKLAAYETNGKPNDEYIKKVEEIKTDYQRQNLKMKEDYDKQVSDLNELIKTKDNALMSIKRSEALKEAFSTAGDPRMFNAFSATMEKQITWDSERKEWRSNDGLQSLRELTDKVFNDSPGFLKANISAGASESNITTASYDQYFNPKSSTFNKDKQAELFRKDREKALALLEKYNNTAI